MFETVKIDQICIKRGPWKISEPFLYKLQFSTNVYVHGFLHYMQSVEAIIHCLNALYNTLNVNINWSLHRIQYTKNNLEKFFIQSRKFMNDYIQNILNCMDTESSACRLLLTKPTSRIIFGFIIKFNYIFHPLYRTRQIRLVFQKFELLLNIFKLLYSLLNDQTRFWKWIFQLKSAATQIHLQVKNRTANQNFPWLSWQGAMGLQTARLCSMWVSNRVFPLYRRSIAIFPAKS